MQCLVSLVSTESMASQWWPSMAPTTRRTVGSTTTSRCGNASVSATSFVAKPCCHSPWHNIIASSQSQLGGSAQERYTAPCSWPRNPVAVAEIPQGLRVFHRTASDVAPPHVWDYSCSLQPLTTLATGGSWNPLQYHVRRRTRRVQ